MAAINTLRKPNYLYNDCTHSKNWFMHFNQIAACSPTFTK